MCVYGGVVTKTSWMDEWMGLSLTQGWGSIHPSIHPSVQVRVGCCSHERVHHHFFLPSSILPPSLPSSLSPSRCLHRGRKLLCTHKVYLYIHGVPSCLRHQIQFEMCGRERKRGAQNLASTLPISGSLKEMKATTSVKTGKKKSPTTTPHEGSGI